MSFNYFSELKISRNCIVLKSYKLSKERCWEISCIIDIIVYTDFIHVSNFTKQIILLQHFLLFDLHNISLSNNKFNLNKNTI
jgi:hypothetical protein